MIEYRHKVILTACSVGCISSGAIIILHL
uniref:Uncharacterized protein n=1 Tax=Rhizophora mucronata TaxID=61149 RepID=A0A2P2N7V3_RHIMU